MTDVGTDLVTLEAQDATTRPRSARPRLSVILRRVLVSLLVANGIPAALFYLCLVLTGVWAAIFVALSWAFGALIWCRVTGRRTSGLLVLTAMLMTGRTAIALATDSTFLYFLQPVISDAIVATVFGTSLLFARPMVARLAGDFYPMDTELALRPRIRRLFWRLTALWATLCLGKAILTLWLLQSQSLETFVVVKGASVLLLNAAAAVVTIGAAALVARREGLIGVVPMPRMLAASV